MAEVAVIIPVYNKADTVARAIKSVAGQTFQDIECVIVNDGSTDDSAAVVAETIESLSDSPCAFSYVYQENAGVAHARNNGVFNYTTAPYVMCLDADDAIEPGYIAGLLPELSRDRTFGIVYTRLYWYKPDGTHGVSVWPGEFDVEKQFAGQNQIPTAALTRRAVWDRLGGQRQRYAPLGAGAEDGDFWLRAVSRGFDVKFVQLERGSWFLYALGSGLVSGNKEYREVNYRAWSPWVSKKDIMPPQSILPTRHREYAYGVRWYDEPLISVIIPVGDSHLYMLDNALDSLDAQTFRNFETIVVFDVRPETWARGLAGRLSYIANTWPDCKFTSTAASGKLARDITSKLDADINGMSILDQLPAGKRAGPGVARNIGLRHASAPLVFFLDADDWLVPVTLEKMLDVFQTTGDIIYSDHVGVANIKREDLDKVDGKVLAYDDRKGEATLHQKVADYKCELAMEQPILDGTPPYVICNVSTLVPRKWINDVGGFDETIDSWEDVLLFWRLAWAGHCFTRVPEPLLVYRYYTGEMRDYGLRNAPKLLKYLHDISESTVKMGCNCGKSSEKLRQLQEAAMANGATAVLRLSRGGQLPVADSELVMIEFHPQNQGQIQRYGQNDFGGGNRIAYGPRKSGDKFLVHRLDYDAEMNLAGIQGRPPEFQLLAAPNVAVAVEEEPEPEPEPPVPIEEPIDFVGFEDLDVPDGFEVSEVFIEPVMADISFPDPEPTFYEVPIRDLEIDLMRADTYMAYLLASEIYTIGDLLAYEDEHENGIKDIRGIGPKIREAILEAVEKARADF
jgi:glycosyltransferase involved in cell wall biosynthesis